MKAALQGFWLTCLLGSHVSNLQAADTPAVKVTGIVRLANRTRALLELKERFQVRSVTLAEGERDGGYEVAAINEKAAKVTLRHGADPLIEAALDQASGEELAKRTLNFQSAKLEDVLGVYQMLAKRTVIWSWRGPEERLDLKSGAGLSDTDALALLKKALEQKGMLVEPRGDKFVLIAPADQAMGWSQIPEPPASGPGPEGESIAPGLIKFISVDALQVLDIYAELSGRAILRTQWLPPTKISVKSETRMTRIEAVWLLEAVFRAQGIALVQKSEKFAFAVPVSMENNLPKFDPAAAAAKARKTAGPGTMKFMDSEMLVLLKTYAELLGREALPLSRNFPAAKFSLKTPTQLSQPEATFALEAVASLNNCKLELVGEDQVQLIPAGEAKRLAR